MTRHVWIFSFLILFLLGCTQSAPSPAPTHEITIPLATSLTENETLPTHPPSTNFSLVRIIVNLTPNVSHAGEINLSAETNLSNESPGGGGLIFGEGKYALILEDIVLDETKPGGACAAVRIVGLMYNNSVISVFELEKDKICKESDSVWVAPDGRTYRIRLLEIVAGYSQEAKWAKFRIFG